MPKVGGYLEIDHRESPGVSEEAIGRGMLSAPKGKRLETEFFVCSHCQATVIKNPKRERLICFGCMKVVCKKCKAISVKAGCQPMAKRFAETYEQVSKGGIVYARK